MYFLSEEERRYLLRKLLPEARENEVHPELRGWNWHNPPLAPVYDVRLGVYEVANKYCPTGRDVYLRRVLGVKAPPNLLMVEGQLFHEAMAEIILQAKRVIYAQGVDCLDGLQALEKPPAELLAKYQIPEDEKPEAQRKLELLWAFEHRRILTRVQDILARQPYIGPDSLVSLALPVVVEQKLDGRFLGLSPYLSADAFLFAEPMVLDIKFDKRRDFHRLSTTGYALVMESLFEFPVNVGCIVYPEFRDDRLIVRRDFHLIDDELRQWFIEERDERMRMVEEEIDPGVAEECYAECPYWRECHPE